MSNLSSGTKFLDPNKIIFLGVALIIACGGSDHERLGNEHPVATPVLTQGPSEIHEADDSATKLSKLNEAKDCRGFFEAFPNSFANFDRLYGYDDRTGERALYSQYESHISYFFGCPDIPARERLEKAIGIGIDGRWDADAIGLFQDASYELIRKHPTESKEILDALSETKASSFWYFLFDGPHPQDKATVEKVNILSDALGEGTRQSKLLIRQHQKLIEDWHKH